VDGSGSASILNVPWPRGEREEQREEQLKSSVKRIVKRIVKRGVN
jgi:hypothetical protein